VAPAVPDPEVIEAMDWASIVAEARGSTVTWRMWRGDPSINQYVEEWVAPRLLEQYGITLNAVDGQGPEILNQLVVEREARARGFADLVWINGETFHSLRTEELLFGPWAHRIPAAEFVDSSSAIVLRDFEQPIEGMESPWGRVQFALIYDTLRTPDPPRTLEALGSWILDHPGRFTHDQEFTGVTFLKAALYALNGGVDSFAGGFDLAAWDEGSERLWAWLEARESAFWREGVTYPQGVADLHRLFANDEIDFTMSNNQNEVVTKVLPESSRALVLRDGTIANAHYVGIPFNARNVAGAMVVADFLLSPEAQLEKARPEVWADGTVLDRARLPAEWRIRFEGLETDLRSIPPDTLARYAVPEVAPEYHERIAVGWRERIRGGE
jgi:putative spermidine/putrescine transport system substrate-binding protein